MASGHPRLFAAVGIATAMLVAGNAAAEDKPIRIGVIYDLLGPFAGAGAVAQSIGTQIAIDMINERGGVLGKYKVEPVKADAQSKVDVAINEAERLIHQEHVDIIIGIYSSSQAVPLAAKLDEEKKILWINAAIATAVFKDRNLHYVFRAQMHSDQYGEAGIAFLAENSKPKLGIEPKDLTSRFFDGSGFYRHPVSAKSAVPMRAEGPRPDGYSIWMPASVMILCHFTSSASI